MSKFRITKYIADFAKGEYSMTLSDGRVFNSGNFQKDIRVNWKPHFDHYIGWTSVEDKIWFDEGSSEARWKARMIATGQHDF